MKTQPHADPRSLWVTWYQHRRTSGICEAWGIPLQVLVSRRRGLAKWLHLSWRTIATLLRVRPRRLFIPNPSLGLAVLAVVLRPALGYTLVIDAHNEGVRPFVRSGRAVRWLTRMLLRTADLTLVSNHALAADVIAAGGRPAVLPDALPAVAPGVDPERMPGGRPKVAVVCTFAPDEPIDAILEATAALPAVDFTITGNPAARGDGRALARENVAFAGFLPERDYWALLAGSDVICDLTMMPDCLVCGAYEGLALGKPMVLSDNRPTRDLFGGCAVFTDNNPASIATAIRDAISGCGILQNGATITREAFVARWSGQAAAVWKELAGSRESGSGPGR